MSYKRKFKKPTNYRKNNYSQNYSVKEDIFIDFCYKKAIKITDKYLYNQLVYQLSQVFMFETQQQILPYQKLNHPKYLITIYNENKHNFLLFLTRINNKNYNIFIHIQNNQYYFYSVKFRFDSQLYNGTLFTGELCINEKKCWFFNINDLLYHSGNYTQQYPMSNKLKLISNILKDQYEYDEIMNVCHLKIKSYFLLNHLQFIKKNCKIIFISDNYNENNYYLDINVDKKNKEELKDGMIKKFIIKKTNKIDVYKLHDMETKEYDSVACINSLNLSLYLRRKFKELDEFEIKNKYSEYFKSWIPIQDLN